MPSVGQIEKKRQEQVLALLSQRLGYTRPGDWIDRPANSNMEPEHRKTWLASQRVGDTLVARALFELHRIASDTSKSLYDRTHAVYRPLRYGMKTRPEALGNTVTVWLMSWADAVANDSTAAEEGTVPGGNLVSGARASTRRALQLALSQAIGLRAPGVVAARSAPAAALPLPPRPCRCRRERRSPGSAAEQDTK